VATPLPPVTPVVAVVLELLVAGVVVAPVVVVLEVVLELFVVGVVDVLCA